VTGQISPVDKPLAMCAERTNTPQRSFDEQIVTLDAPMYVCPNPHPAKGEVSSSLNWLTSSV
jgi:hypothetical protein